MVNCAKALGIIPLVAANCALQAREEPRLPPFRDWGLSVLVDWIDSVSRFRMYPTQAQQAALLEQCSQARYVWNLALEQWSMWTPDRGPTPGYIGQARQLTEARAAFGWLRAGSQTVQQQALRDFDQAAKNFYAGTHQRPTWRKAGLHEGFRVVGRQASRVARLNGKWARVLVPKVGWVRLRLSRAVPDAKSYRITRDQAGRWQIAFAVVPPPLPAPGTAEVVGVDRGVTVSAALSTGELLSCPDLSEAEQVRLKQLQRRLARCCPGSNRRRRVKAAIARLHARAGDRRKDWVEKTSTDLARRFDLIRVEDLRITQMTRRPKPKRPYGSRRSVNLSTLPPRSGWNPRSPRGRGGRQPQRSDLAERETRLNSMSFGVISPATTFVTCSAIGISTSW
jgi:transposase